MIGDISWAIVVFAVGWYCRGKFGSVGAMYTAGKAKWDTAFPKK